MTRMEVDFVKVNKTVFVDLNKVDERYLFKTFCLLTFFSLSYFHLVKDYLL